MYSDKAGTPIIGVLPRLAPETGLLPQALENITI